MSARSSKFADLPDIENDAPEVFETPDVPADSAYDLDGDSDGEDHAPAMAPQRSNSSEDLVNNRLEPSKARKHFKDARVNGEADFSTSLGPRRRKQRSRYPTPMPETSIYEYMPRGYSTEPPEPVAGGSKESPVQRIRRLRLEMEEVEAQIEADLPSTTERDGAGKSNKAYTRALLAQLRFLRHDLSRLDTEAGKSQSNNSEGGGTKLLEKMGTSLPTDDAGKPTAHTAGVQDITPGGDLDARLARLERAVGAGEVEADEAHSMPAPLVSQLSKLENQLQLLTQPRHLDTIARRVKTLVGDLERIHEARRKIGDTRPLNIALASGISVVTPGTSSDPVPEARKTQGQADDLPPDALTKIDTLFALLPRIEPLIPLAPQLLLRLKTLAPLHADAVDFHETLTAVQRDTTGLKDAEMGIRDALDRVTKSIEENEQTVQSNLRSLQERVEAVTKRMDALRGS